MPTLTILTPVYNRINYIKRLFSSLIQQTNSDFQWLVIDDGSTDGTDRWFKNLNFRDYKFNVDYFYKKNGGKHTAINFSQPYIKGKYIIIVDSDDILVPCAVNEIIKYWHKYSSFKNIGSIVFQRGDINTKEAFDQNIKGEYISTIAKEINKGMHGDHCETFRSDLFQSCKFPVYENENFVAEGAMWYRITKGWNVVYVNKVIYLAKYLKNGLTLSVRKLRITNPKGERWHAKMFLHSDFNFKVRMKNALLFDTYSHFIGNSLLKDTSGINISSKILLLICWLPSFLIYKGWKYKYGN